MLKVAPWKGLIRFGRRGKLSPRYIGPFKITQKVGEVAYRLELPIELQKIHSTFHVSNLRKCLAEEEMKVPLEEIHVNERLTYVEQPERIIDRAIRRLRNKEVPLVKVQWKYHKGRNATWENEQEMRTNKCCHMEEKRDVYDSRCCHMEEKGDVVTAGAALWWHRVFRRRPHQWCLLYEAKGLPKEALKAYENALDIDPAHVQSLVSMALVLRRIGGRSGPEIRSFLTEALRLDRMNSSAWYNLGQFYKDEGPMFIKEAADCFEAATVLEETEPIEPFR
ncbi:hypothetical protein OSB04_001128 [Centaurea solstitialis]|uniref:Tf2-1-like SH3-like domain-containing protein n=1 Tax=Centaurea solstitialis TaxID=347529 RepID=A0AA38WLF6_9ASTR|nr:hypothetical protein OSB04_001128 [Centaurea solstitialis]